MLANTNTEEQEAVLRSEDTVVLRQELQRVYEQLRQQEAEIKKLKFDLEMEHGHVNILKHDNQVLKQTAVEVHASAEQEEEYISNKLLKRISGLRKEKSELLLQVEQEEEYLTNTLQKKLNQLQKEKIDMENALEQEQEYIVNRLQKQLDSLRQQQQHTHAHSHPSRENSVSSSSLPSTPLLPPPSPSSTHKKWLPSHSPSPTSSEFTLTSSHGVTEILRVEVNELRTRMSEIEKEYMSKAKQATRYKNELIELRKRLGMPVEDLLVEEPPPAFLRLGTPRAKIRRANSATGGLSSSSSSGVRGRSVSTSEHKPSAGSSSGHLETSGTLLRSRSVSSSLGLRNVAMPSPGSAAIVRSPSSPSRPPQ